MITVFTGGPAASPDPPTHWDALAGFSAGDDVLGARKLEDAAALAAVGAVPVWLDHLEHQYLERPDWVGAGGGRRQSRGSPCAPVRRPWC